MKRAMILTLSLAVLCAAPAMAQVEALGLGGTGAHWNADGDITLTAFTGANIYVQKGTDLSVLNRTIYRWSNEAGTANEPQSIETYLLSKIPVYGKWFVTLGGGADMEINDAEDKTHFAMLFEIGRQVYQVDLFCGLNVVSKEDAKHTYAYVGISLN